MSQIKWAGNEDSFYAVEAIFKQINEASAETKKQASEWDDEQEELESEHDLLQMDGSIAIITIRGAMVEGSAGYWGRMFGIVGYDDIRNASIAAANAGAEEILFHINSPGGMVMGIGACTDFLKEMNAIIPISFYTDSQCASGGIWLAATFGNLMASQHAEVGSIGVMGVTTEYTEAYKMAGIAKRVFKSVPLKASGNPNEKLDAANAAEIQRSVDESATRFIDHLASGLKLSSDFVATNLATGQMWYAAQAKQLGLVSGITTFDKLLVDLQKKVQQNITNAESTSYSQTLNVSAEADMTKRKLIKASSPEELLAMAASGVTLVAEADAPEAEAEADAPEAEADVAKVGEIIEAPTTPFDKLMQQSTDKLIEVSVLLAATKTELAVSSEKLATAAANETQLKNIVVLSIQRAFVASGSAAPETAALAAMGAEALIAQSVGAEAMLAKRFGTGGRVSVEIDESESDETKGAEAIAQHFEQASFNASRIGKR